MSIQVEMSLYSAGIIPQNLIFSSCVPLILLTILQLTHVVESTLAITILYPGLIPPWGRLVVLLS